MKKFIALLFVGILVFSACSKKEKALLVGTEPTFPPFEYIEKGSDEIIGFDIDIIKAIAEDQSFEVEIKNMGFDGLVPALQSGNIDIIASGMTITDERKKKISFSDPYINTGLAIAVRADDTSVKGQNDLKGKAVAVQIGTTGAEKANELKESGMVGEVKVFNTIDVLMMELINRGVDAVINDLPVTQVYTSKHGDKIKIVGDPLTSEDYGFGVQIDNADLLEKINNGLSNLIEDGTYKKLQEKYFQ